MPRQKRRSAWSSRNDRIVAPDAKPRNRAFLVAGGGLGVILAVFLVSFLTSPDLQHSEPSDQPLQAFDESPEPLSPEDRAKIASSGFESEAPEPSTQGTEKAPTPKRPPELQALQRKTPVIKSSQIPSASSGSSQAPPLDPLVEEDWQIGEQIGSPEEAIPGSDELDPQLLAGHELELRNQLSAIDPETLSGNQLDNIRSIALGASDEQTKTLAIQALGLNRSDQSQRILRELFDATMDLQAKDQILSRIRPQSFNDLNGQWLLLKLGAPGIPDEIQQQIVFALVGSTINPGNKGNTSNLESLAAMAPPQFRDQIYAAYQRLSHN